MFCEARKVAIVSGQTRCSEEQALAFLRTSLKVEFSRNVRIITEAAHHNEFTDRRPANKLRTLTLKAIDLYVFADADRDLLQDASRLGLESALQNLCQRQDVLDANVTLSSQLEALRQTNGLVNPARRILLEL